MMTHKKFIGSSLYSSQLASILLLSICFLFPAVGIIGQVSNSVIYILDGSGSMWGEMKGSTKIAIAKEVMGELSAKHSAEELVGLVVYGHRKQGDCQDVEFVIHPELHHHATFSEAVKEINPVGRTPLFYSAKMVIDYLTSSGSKATIVMITDGNETCDGDLCQLVKDARDQGIEFVMHIVGFGMGEEDRTSLECAARATGGQYMDAEDAGQLSEALQQANELKVEEIAPSLAVKAIKDGELVDALITAYKSGTEEDVARMRTYAGTQTNPAIFHLPDGIYDLTAEVIARSGITIQSIKNVLVKSDEMEEEIFDFSSGRMSILVTDNGDLADATVNIYSKTTGKRVDGGRSYEHAANNPVVKELSPGSYYVLIKSVNIKGLEVEERLDDIAIHPGQLEEIKHEFDSAVLSIQVTHGGVLCDAAINITSLSPKKAISGGRTYSDSSSNPRSFLLNPGTYQVEIRGVRVEGDPRDVFTITLEKGDDVQRKIELK